MAIVNPTNRLKAGDIMASLNNETWTKVYTGKKADVFGIYGPGYKKLIFQTADKDGNLTGWRYGNNIRQAKKAADEDGR
jgi:hypothetical protein